MRATPVDAPRGGRMGPRGQAHSAAIRCGKERAPVEIYGSKSMGLLRAYVLGRRAGPFAQTCSFLMFAAAVFSSCCLQEKRRLPACKQQAEKQRAPISFAASLS